MIDKRAPHTQKLHNTIPRKRAKAVQAFSQATASAHSKQTKLELMLDFHCMFSSNSILILCLKMERRDYYDDILTDIR